MPSRRVNTKEKRISEGWDSASADAATPALSGQHASQASQRLARIEIGHSRHRYGHHLALRRKVEELFAVSLFVQGRAKTLLESRHEETNFASNTSCSGASSGGGVGQHTREGPP